MRHPTLVQPFQAGDRVYYLKDPADFGTVVNDAGKLVVAWHTTGDVDPLSDYVVHRTRCKYRVGEGEWTTPMGHPVDMQDGVAVCSAVVLDKRPSKWGPSDDQRVLDNANATWNARQEED